MLIFLLFNILFIYIHLSYSIITIPPFGFTEQGTIGCYCSWRGPNWIGCLASTSMQKDGNSLLHSERQSTPWICKWPSVSFSILVVHLKLGYASNALTLLQIVHKKTASVLCLTSVKNEDKLEFSKILEAIKVWMISLLMILCIFFNFELEVILELLQEFNFFIFIVMFFTGQFQR